MGKPESVLEYETHKIHWDFEIHMNHPIPARRLDLVLIYKKNFCQQLQKCISKNNGDILGVNIHGIFTGLAAQLFCLFLCCILQFSDLYFHKKSF